MDLAYLKKLLKLLDDSDSNELVIEEEGTKIKISKATKGSQIVQMPQQPMVQPAHQNIQQTVPTPVQAVEQPAVPSEGTTKAADDSDGMHVINSPIVGTYYSAPSPESPSFVDIGTKVTAGQTLCIIEAMKLMNEIESDVAGTVEKILVKNGSPIEFNQPLFVIKPE